MEWTTENLTTIWKGLRDIGVVVGMLLLALVYNGYFIELFFMIGLVLLGINITGRIFGANGTAELKRQQQLFKELLETVIRTVGPTEVKTDEPSLEQTPKIEAETV